MFLSIGHIKIAFQFQDYIVSMKYHYVSYNFRYGMKGTSMQEIVQKDTLLGTLCVLLLNEVNKLLVNYLRCYSPE